MLWLHPFILSGVISPLISRSILGTYQPGEFIFPYPIFLPSHTVHGVLKARPCLVSTLHHDPSILGGPTQQRSTSKTVGGGAAAAQCPSSCEEIPHTHGQRRSPSETVGGAKSRFESYPIPPRDAQRLKPSLCTPGPRDPTETEIELCLSVSWGGDGSQKTAAGAGPLGPADRGLA